MKWFARTLIFVSIAFTWFLSAAFAGSEPKIPPHLEWAETLVRELQPDCNVYAYKPMYVRWKGEDRAERFEARCDCSGMLTFLMEHSYGYSPGDLKRWTGKYRPVARVYHDQIEQEHGFKRIRLVGDILPGDILAVKFLSPVKDTGHVMIVASTPGRRQASEPFETGMDQWEVEVIDSAMSGHGLADTRHKIEGGYSTGVGRGTFRLYSDAHGVVIGYTWSTSRKSKIYQGPERDLVIGRLAPGFSPVRSQRAAPPAGNGLASTPGRQ